MALYSFLFSICFVFVSFLGYAHSKKPELTLFGKEVKKDIPENTFKKIFSFNAKNDGEFRKAIRISSRKFFETLGIPYEESEEEETESDNEKVGIKNIDSEVLFHSITFAISKAFTDMGRLSNKGDIKDLAQKFVDKLNEAAKSVKDLDVVSTFTALDIGVASFLKSEGVTSKPKVQQVINDFREELAKYQKKS